MRKHLLTASFFSGALLLTTLCSAQSPDRFAWAITDMQPNGANWSFLRKLNLHNGEYSQVLLQGNDVNALSYDAATKKQLAVPMTDARSCLYRQAR